VGKDEGKGGGTLLQESDISEYDNGGDSGRTDLDRKASQDYVIYLPDGALSPYNWAFSATYVVIATTSTVESTH